MSEITEKIMDILAGGEHPTPFELFETAGGELSYEDFCRELEELEKLGAVVISKKGKVLPQAESGLVRGVYKSAAKGFGFVVPEDSTRADIYIPAGSGGGAINGDTVLAAEGGAPKSKGASPEGRVVRVLTRAIERVIGTLRAIELRTKKGAPRFYVEPDERKLGFNILVEASTQGAVTVSPGDKVEVELIQYPDVSAGINAYGRITQVFGESDSVEANYAAVLRDCGIITDFTPAALAEAERVSAEEVKTDGRLDLRDKLIYTIDGADAKDLDDAISVEKHPDGSWTLGVHIADVSEYVKPGSALDSDAFDRGTSVYFTDKVVPMLPEAISNGSCSLNSGVDRRALSALISLTPEGEIAGCELHESVIRTVVRGVYSELNDIVEKGDSSDFAGKYSMLLPEAFGNALELYHVLDLRSGERGALELETTEAKIILDDDGYVADIVKRERGLTERMIEQFMLCANEAVAGWLFWQDMPCVYRVHEDPSPEKMKAFTVFAHNLGLNIAPLRTRVIHSSALRQVILEAKEKGIEVIASYVLLRSLAKARYDAACSPHFGLAIEKYCHFTSPIRRYPDLSVHRIIKTILRGELDEKRLAELEAFAKKSAEQSSETELRAIRAERDIEALYKALYMEDHIGERFDGVISSVTSFGFFVELENTCEGLVHISTLDGYFDYNEGTMSLHCGRRAFTLGQRVRVEIENADISTRKVSMLLVGDDGE